MAYRFNSTIKIPEGACIKCNDGEIKLLAQKNPPLCTYHLSQSKADDRRRNAAQRTMMGISKIKDETLEAWFKDRRKEMMGHCLICGGKTTKDNDKEFKRSVAHLFAKRPSAFPSIASHPDNWIELCFYGESCHTNFDNNMISLEELKKNDHVWDVIVTKFKKVYPHIAAAEIGRLPNILLQEL